MVLFMAGGHETRVQFPAARTSLRVRGEKAPGELSSEIEA